MTDTPPRETHPGDEELLGRVRAGDVAAFEELYRDHVDGARHLARILVGPEHADELTAESFARVLAQLKAGKGPTSNFRSYLHVTIRNGYRDGLRATTEAPASDQPWLFDEAEPAAEEMVEGFDETVAVDALSSLPENWQQILWHLEVEGKKPGEVAEILDMRPGAVSSLAYRAREGLKRAYLDLHVGPAPAREQCRWTHARMSQHARGDLGAKAQQKFDAHLDTCASCSAAYLTVDRVNQKLAAYVLPVVLLAAVPGGGKALVWLWGAGGAAAGSGGAAGGGTVTGGPLSSVRNNPGVATAASVAVVAAVAGAAWGVAAAGGDERQPPVAADDRTSPAAVAPPTSDPSPPVDPPTSRPPEPKPPNEPVVAPPPTAVPTAEPADEPTVEPTEQPTVEPTNEPTNEPTEVPTPEPTVVVPVRPVAQRITECETYGSLELPTTKGVDYVLARGNGQEGPWVVTASAQDGYVIEDGAQRRFEGDLGDWSTCEVDLVDTVGVSPPSSPNGPWDVTATVVVEGGGPKMIEVVFRLDQGAEFLTPDRTGWLCDLAGLRTITCRFAYAGSAPPPVMVTARKAIPGGADGMSGSATLLVDGSEAESRPFSAGPPGNPGPVTP